MVSIQSGVLGQVTGAYQRSIAPAPPAALHAPVQGAARRRDSVMLTRAGEELRQLLKVLQNSPDTREEKVQQLREAVTAGTYDAGGADLATKLVETGGI